MKKYLYTVLMCFSAFSYSANTNSGRITTLMNAFGGWIFQADMTNGNPDSCERTTFILAGDHSQHKEIYSLILTAYTTGNPVTIFTNGCDANGYINVTSVFTSWGR